MLTGAMRAARTAGVLRLERVWVVAVPVVVVVVLERLSTFLFSFATLGAAGDPVAMLVGRGGPWNLRTTTIATLFATSGYALVWSILALADYVREVRRRGRRAFLRGGDTGRLVILGGLFLLLAYLTTAAFSLPTAETVLADAAMDLRTERWTRFVGAVQSDVPGIRRLCQDNLANASLRQRTMAAAALWRLGVEEARVRELLRAVPKEEFTGRIDGRFVYGLCRLLYIVPYAHGEMWREVRERAK